MKFIRREKLTQGAPVRDLVYDLCNDDGSVVLKEDRYGFAKELASPQLAEAQEPFRNSKVTVRPSAATHNSSHKFKLVLRARLSESQGAQNDVIELK
jgi:hypothetical protein